MIAGCGGGGGGGSASTVSGVASAGAPLTGTVYLKDAKGVERSTQISANGEYAIDVSGLTAPYILKSGSYYSFASGAGATNVNPLSHASIVIALGGGQSRRNIRRQPQPVGGDCHNRQ